MLLRGKGWERGGGDGDAGGGSSCHMSSTMSAGAGAAVVGATAGDSPVCSSSATQLLLGNVPPG